MVPAGTTQAHTARAEVGVRRRITWMLKGMEMEVERGDEVAKTYP